jgi:hypothetical protein
MSTSGTSGVVILTPIENGKLWFNENIELNVTKIRLSTWRDGCIVPTNISSSDKFIAVNDNGEIKAYHYSLDWRIKTTVMEMEDSMQQAIQNTYYLREIDGKDFYRKMRASLLQNVLLGNITEADADVIDTSVEAIVCKILTGDWKSAKNRLNETVVNGAYTQEFRDKLLLDIETYIEENY